eukprot:1484187-Pyramimonas_sp.AAC.1
MDRSHTYHTHGAYFRGKNCTRFSEPFCEFQLLTRKVVIAPHPEAGQYVNMILPRAGFYHFSAVEALPVAGEIFF